MKSLKTWKAIIQFVITILTAIASSFAVQSCINGNVNETLKLRNATLRNADATKTGTLTGTSTLSTLNSQH